MSAYRETVDLLGPDGEALLSVEASLERTITAHGHGWGGILTLQDGDRTPEWIRSAYALRLPVTIRTGGRRTGAVVIEALWRRASNPWQAKVAGVGMRPFD